jgi:hypothetical protein
MHFRVGRKYMIHYDDGTWKVYYVLQKTPKHVVLRDGHSDYRRKIRVGDDGEYVDLDGLRLRAWNEVDATKYPVGYSESLMDQVWYPNASLPNATPTDARTLAGY